MVLEPVGVERSHPPLRQPVDVLSSIGILVAGNAVGIPAGWISRVAPRAQNVPHGRFYVGLFLQDSRGNELGLLWGGYLTNVVPVSTPNIQVSEGFVVVAKVGQTNSGVTGTRIVLDVDIVDQAPAGAGFVFVEPMFSGPGDKRSLVLGAPAAGAQYIGSGLIFVVGAPGMFAVIGFAGSLTTSAVVPARLPKIEIHDNPGNVADDGFAVVTIPASSVAVCRGGTFQAATGVPTSVPISLPVRQYPGGFSVTFATASMDAADQWSAGTLELEEWAGL
jgi:hypothetical protein